MDKVTAALKPIYSEYPSLEVVPMEDIEWMENRLRTEADNLAAEIRRRKYPAFVNVSFR